MLREECPEGRVGKDREGEWHKGKGECEAKKTRGEGIKKFPFGFLFGPTKVGFTPH